MPLFSVKWFKPQGIPCHGDSTSHKGDPLIIPGEVVNVLHHVTVGSSPRDPRPQESRPRAFEAFFPPHHQRLFGPLEMFGDDLGGNPTSEKRALSQGMHTSENDHSYEVQKKGHIF